MDSAYTGRVRALRLALVASLALSAQGCYLAHATKGQLGVLFGRTPIADVLEEGELDGKPLTKDQRHKLELVLDVRRFAIDRLGLAETGSYTSLHDTGKRPVAWNVSASAPDALAPFRWWFPIVGTMPYVGYFAEGPARVEAFRLRRMGLDPLVLPVPAYSTLGWFDDPFFSSMLRYDEATIASIIVHEMTHATVFIHGDAEFNEALAQFVGDKGAELYFLQRGGPTDPALAVAREDHREEDLFAKAAQVLEDRLWTVYESCAPRERKLARKAEVIDGWRRWFLAEVRPQLGDPRWDRLFDGRIRFDNAFILQLARYHGDSTIFEALWRQEGQDLAATVTRLGELAEEEDPRVALEEHVAATNRALRLP